MLIAGCFLTACGVSPKPTLSVSPARAGLVVRQTLSIVATTTDSAGVTWSATGSSCSGNSCGAFSASTSLNGVAVTYTAPLTAGVYAVTATSKRDSSVSATLSVAVTDLAGVTTYHNDLSRSGANTQEYALTPSTVTTATFGKLYSCAVDGAVYGQPLWIPNLTIASARHNVAFVATQADSVYAFDADSGGASCAPLWHASLLDSAHGAFPGETTVPSYGTGDLVGQGFGDISPEVGVTSTPVIDLSTNTMYVVSKSVDPSGPTFYQRLHALDLLTGNEKSSGPATIQGTYPGTADGSSTTTFVPRQENQRSGLALVNGVVYIAWGAHEDAPPYSGWVMGYNAGNLSQASVLNVTPNSGWAGVWMSGGAPAADSSGNVYVITANGQFDATNASAPNNDYGDSFLKLNSGLSVSQYFTPSDEANDQVNDNDFGSGGAMVLVDLPPNGANPTHLMMGGGKDGILYVLNRDAMGGYGDSNAWQQINTGSGVHHGGIFATGAYWNSTYYLGPSTTAMQAYALNASTAKLTLMPNTTPATFPWPGSIPSISSMPDNSNGIVWALQNNSYCTPGSKSCGPTILHAYNANNLSIEYWNSTMGSGNTAGYAVKFTVPTVANGKVYVGTRGNNTGGADNSTSIPGELDVYGLLPN